MVRLLEHMALVHRREVISDRINNAHYTEALETVKNFIKLFIIDKGALFTLSKDECSRKISVALMKQYEKEKKERSKVLAKSDIIKQKLK